MTVTVVGQDDGSKRRATCYRCCAVVEFHRMDIKMGYLYSMGEYDGSYTYVVCPRCGEKIHTKEEPAK